jgi:two-component system sensor histidine kinase DegS
VLDDLGLVAGVRMLAESRLEQHGVEVSLTTKGLERRLPAHLELAIFRVLQEAINNCARHANAKLVHISLQSDNGSFEATIQDDGVGFDVSSIAQPTSDSSPLGLLGMRERASLLGGNLEVFSKPGIGTSVKLTIPPAIPGASQ